MTSYDTPQPQQPARPQQPGRIQWPLIGGLACLALLWPLTALTGLGSGAPRALAIVGITGAVWIGVVGFGRVARPVLTLTLTGLAFGVLTILLSLVFAGIDGAGPGGAAWTALPALAMDAFWGFLAGLIALGIQRARGDAR
ncbi:hypothetical protein [Myceligenerans pegani]|uniref:Uncharacterized protein n=1 Tax=Myceligenerans pegani TaxID=2776917 RepID=A0ABR9MY02_9MICO|nr:hypothetical protein [Myceligenerans sp. TRM 65318]MBE1875799.1 hypothetical protein [Myceligenerans sp. TRM 65318]MBE3018070.1 hypothetical protein [Myceligenerans sp. TRM 65318]